MNRRDFLGTIGPATVSFSVQGCGSANQQLSCQNASPPNILFIMSADHSAQAISCYGSKINKTPNIDRIAREGMQFDKVS